MESLEPTRQRLLGRKAALLGQWIAAVLVLLTAVAGCAGDTKRLSDSDLGRVLNQRDATRRTQIEVVTDAVLQFIPLGTPEQQAAETFRKSGFQQDGKYDRSPDDMRCPSENTGYPCRDPTNKSDYYLSFSIVTKPGFVTQTSYIANIGIKSGLVEFLFAEIRTDGFDL